MFYKQNLSALGAEKNPDKQHAICLIAHRRCIFTMVVFVSRNNFKVEPKIPIEMNFINLKISKLVAYYFIKILFVCICLKKNDETRISFIAVIL